MKTQINFRASALTINQLAELNDRWGTQTTETIAIAIDRIYREETAAMEQITVREYADESSLFGDNPTDGIDITASINKYAMMISDAISVAYPGATVFVTRGSGVQAMTVNGCNAGQMYGSELDRYHEIEQIIHDVWESWEWVINVA